MSPPAPAAAAIAEAPGFSKEEGSPNYFLRPFFSHERMERRAAQSYVPERRYFLEGTFSRALFALSHTPPPSPLRPRKGASPPSPFPHPLPSRRLLSPCRPLSPFALPSFVRNKAIAAPLFSPKNIHSLCHTHRQLDFFGGFGQARGACAVSPGRRPRRFGHVAVRREATFLVLLATCGGERSRVGHNATAKTPPIGEVASTFLATIFLAAFPAKKETPKPFLP
jgi:hypothetical protein